jgi:hypothetical protein
MKSSWMRGLGAQLDDRLAWTEAAAQQSVLV